MLSAAFTLARNSVKLGGFNALPPYSDDVTDDPGSGHHAQLRDHEKEQTHKPGLLQ